ncbi:MAG: hypothetical protein WCO56_02915 [Verrucomicrobiota bacterium]
MKHETGRRSFLKQSFAATLAAPLITSLEEYALVARESGATTAPVNGGVPCGTIGKVRMSRIICGGNLVSGYAHSRDLIYLSKLLKSYFTEAKIMETWAVCEQHGVNTMIFNPSDRRAVEIYKKYCAQGGKIQYLAQVAPKKEDMLPTIREAVDNGASGILLVGNYGDSWTRDGSVDRIGEFIAMVKAERLISGVAGHELRTIMTVEKAGIQADFYMKTLHSADYWSKQREDQKKEVIDNYGIDNYWCQEPGNVVEFMQQVKRPWLAYKVLAAGAIHPREGFKYAFENGADFCVVGMFDFQVAEDAAIAREVLGGSLNRKRAWLS